MRPLKRPEALCLLAPAWLFAACAMEVPLDEDEVSSVEQAYTATTGNPPLRSTTSSPLAPLPGTTNIALGNYQRGDVLNVGPISSTTTWKDQVYGDSKLVPSGTKTRTDDIIDDALSRNTARFNDMEAVYDAFRDATFVSSVTEGTPTNSFFGYAPQRGRWMDRLKTSSSDTSYADPTWFAEHRQRGARLYCAAKEAFNRSKNSAGDGKTLFMGRKSLATLNILGKRLDLMTLEPTVAMGAPQKRVAADADGVQAFNLRMAVGTRFTPISLMDTTPEIRTPVNFIIEDAEVLTRANNTATTFEQWQTVTHAGAFLSSRRADEIVFNDILLFTIGPVPVFLTSNLTLSTEPCSDASSLTDCDANRRQAVKRIWDGAPTFFGYPARRSGGFTVTNELDSLYNDNFWTYLGANGANVGGNSPYRILIPAPSPLQTRFFQSDDKSLEVRTNVALTMGVRAGLKGSDLPFFPSFIDFEVTVSGDITGNATMVHEIRESLYDARRPVGGPGDAVGGHVGETGLSVTPYTEVGLGAEISGVLKFDIYGIPFISPIHLGGELFREHLDIANEKSANWAESKRLRIATGSADGLGMGWHTQWAKYHLPGGSEFPSLPTALTTCVTGTELSGDIEPACESVSPTYPPITGVSTEPPTANLCFIAEQPPDPNDCQQAALQFIAAQGGADAHVGFVFQGTTPTNAASIILPLLDAPTWHNPMREAISDCAVFHRTDAGVRSDVRVVMCDDDGRPVGPDDVIALQQTGSGGASAVANNACR